VCSFEEAWLLPCCRQTMGIEDRLKNPLIGVIGGTGMMGSWFADICESQGYRVLKVGRRTKVSMEQAAKECDVVVISVPISVTYEVIKKIGPLVSMDSLFMDLTSVKKMPIKAMLRYSDAEVVGLHPLFGADIDHEQPKKVAICNGRGEYGKRWVAELLNKTGFETIFLDCEEHDRIMGIVQGVNHFETICLAFRIKSSGMSWREIERSSTQTFMKKLERIKRLFSQEPELFASLLMDNEWSLKYVDLYLKEAEKLFDILNKKDKDGFKKIFYSIRQFIKRGMQDEGDMG